jgi:PAS domain S-box-containing protein
MLLHHIYAFACIIISILTLYLAFVMAQRQQVRGALTYSALLVAVSVWLFFYVLEIESQHSPIEALLWGKLKYLGSIPTPPLWACFCWQYNRGRIRRSALIGLLIIPILTLVTVIVGHFDPAYVTTNQLNLDYLLTLPEIERIVLVVNLLFGYVMTLAGIFLMAQQVVSMFRAYPWQARLLLVALALPIFTTAISSMRLIPSGGLDYMPLTFGIMFILIAVLFTASDVMTMAAIAYDTVIDSLPDAMIALDLQGRIVTLNVAAQRLIGSTPSQVVGTPLRELENYAPAFAQVLLHANVGTQEVQVGAQYWEITRQPLHSTEGAPSGVLFSLREITASKQAEIALQTNERRYIALFENSNDAIFIIDMAEEILIANERAGLMLHQPLDDLMGSRISQYIDTTETAKNKQHFRTLMLSGFTPIYETTLVRPDGNKLSAEMSLTLVRDMSGEPRHMQAIVRDITERKRIEKSLNARLELSAVLQQVDEELNSSLKVDHVIQVALDAAMRLSRAQAGYIGLIDEEELRVSYMIGKYPPELLNSVIRHDVGISGRVLVNQQPELILNVSTDPDYIAHIPGTVAMMVLPLISQERLVGIIQLVTSRRDVFTDEVFELMMLLSARIAVSIDNSRLHDYVIRQLDETQILYQQLSRLEQLKTDMIRIASHDLKAPLHIIDGYINLLKEDRDQFDAFYWNYFEAIERATSRMQQMLTDILSLERITQRAVGQGNEQFALVDLVETAVEEFYPLAKAKKQTLTTHISSDIPPIEGDKTQLYEAITNLISNAIKYTPLEGQVTVTLNCENNKNVFLVEDTGYGIPEDRQERLFEPFYRARVEGTESTEGTGLGLHLVKSVIERHGGTMQFKSEYQKGSLFGFTLPSASVSASLSSQANRPDAKT